MSAKPLKLAILGAGNVRCSVAVIASLAGYFGERTLEIRLYDADSERLDLFDRFARFAFVTEHAFHSVIATTDAAEAMKDADRAILQVDENCAAKAMRLQTTTDGDIQRQRIGKHLRQILRELEKQTVFLSLQRDGVRVPLDTYYVADWPEEMTPEQRLGIPHQVLRWIRGEEPVFELLRTYEKSPLKEWLDDEDSAKLVHVERIWAAGERTERER